MNKFKLRKGLVVTSFLHATITEHSTDAEFIQALKVSPGAIKYFTEYPENWKDIVSGKEIIPSSKEMREQLKEKGVTIPKGTKQPELIKLWQESK
jgi:ubiquinone/menaquinone biosynthesis C-methylase UbiE